MGRHNLLYRHNSKEAEKKSCPQFYGSQKVSRFLSPDIRSKKMGISWISVFAVLFSTMISAATPALKGKNAARMSEETDETEVVNVRKFFQAMGKSYVLSEDTISTFEGAREFCKNMGGDLASALSYKEYDSIVDHLETADYKNKFIWVGFKRTGEDKSSNKIKTDVQWITGEPIPPSFAKWWQPGGSDSHEEPDKHTYGVIHPTGNVREGDGPSMAVHTEDKELRALCQFETELSLKLKP